MPLFIFGLIVAVLAVGGLAFALLARAREGSGPGVPLGGIAVAAVGTIVADHPGRQA